MQLEAFLMLQVTNLIWGKHIVIHVLLYMVRNYLYICLLLSLDRSSVDAWVKKRYRLLS